MVAITLPEGSRWTVLARAEDYVYPKSGKRTIRYHCMCECGTEKVVHKAHITNGSSKSCGCLNREISSTKEGKGFTNTREYRAWAGMRQRVKSNADRNKCYQNIGICERWEDSFKNFLEDMGVCPEGFELERLDCNSRYGPENCIWASEARQSQNRGIYSNNTSGCKGVVWSKEHGKWRVFLQRNKIKYEGGLFESFEDAVGKRKLLERQYPMAIS